MTKSISLSLILVLVFLLSACTGTPTAVPAASPTSPLPTLPPLVTSTPVQLPTVVSPTAARYPDGPTRSRAARHLQFQLPG